MGTGGYRSPVPQGKDHPPAATNSPALDPQRSQRSGAVSIDKSPNGGRSTYRISLNKYHLSVTCVAHEKNIRDEITYL